MALCENIERIVDALAPNLCLLLSLHLSKTFVSWFLFGRKRVLAAVHFGGDCFENVSSCGSRVVMTNDEMMNNFVC